MSSAGCWRCHGTGMVLVKAKRRPDDPPPRVVFGEMEDADIILVKTACVVCGGTGLTRTERVRREAQSKPEV